MRRPPPFSTPFRGLYLCRLDISVACGQLREPHGQASGLSRPPLVSTRSALLEPKSIPFHPKCRVGIGTYLDIAYGKSVARKIVASAGAQTLSLSRWSIARPELVLQGALQVSSGSSAVLTPMSAEHRLTLRFLTDGCRAEAFRDLVGCRKTIR
jgi:hypothetical protein